MLRYFLLITVITGSLALPTETPLTDPDEDPDFIPYPNRRAGTRSTDDYDEEKGGEFWKKVASNALSERLSRKPNFNTAKNVILFLGDGMSIPTLSATRVYLGGEEKQLSFEQFPYTGISKTYCVDHQTADSACSATAYLCGVKANLGTIGVTAAVAKDNCSAMNNIDNHVDSIARLFQLKNKKTGLVTTTRVTHASPAAVYAHVAARQWEADTNVLIHDQDPNECEDIAHQLIFGDTGSNLNVILGGGRRKFIPREIIDEEGKPGGRYNHVSLIDAWKKLREERGQKAEYVWNREQLLNIQNDTEFVLGLFESSHMAYNLDRNKETDPSLAEMTEAAIKVLQRGDKGFFLFVEGGRIDTAHHESWSQKALDETAELSRAVDKAVSMTGDDTLIVVTSDHAHTMSHSGHAARGSDIFGYAGDADDGKPFPILNYANGPGFRLEKQRFVPSAEEMRETSFRYPSTVPLESERHGADDVMIFAKGPWSHLFTGVMEESVIPHLIAYAGCVGNDVNCDDRNKLA